MDALRRCGLASSSRCRRGREATPYRRASGGGLVFPPGYQPRPGGSLLPSWPGVVLWVRALGGGLGPGRNCALLGYCRGACPAPWSLSRSLGLRSGGPVFRRFALFPLGGRLRSSVGSCWRQGFGGAVSGFVFLFPPCVCVAWLPGPFLCFSASCPSQGLACAQHR